MGVIVKYIIFLYATTLMLLEIVTGKPRHANFSSTATEPGSGSASAALKDNNTGAVLYRVINSNTGKTCILLKTDAIVEVNFVIHNIEMKESTPIPIKDLVDGNCKNEDASSMTISWSGYKLLFNFAKTPGGERWYIKYIELTVSPDLDKFKDVPTHGKPIKLYHKEMLFPTPVGKSYSCEQKCIDLETDEDDNPPPGLRGTLDLRLLQLQPFMYKREDFEAPFECQPQKLYRDETAPIAVGSTLAIAVLMTVTGYGVFRYFKIKNTME